MNELETITELLELALKLSKKANKTLPNRSEKLLELGEKIASLNTGVYRVMAGR